MVWLNLNWCKFPVVSFEEILHCRLNSNLFRVFSLSDKVLHLHSTHLSLTIIFKLVTNHMKV